MAFRDKIVNILQKHVSRIDDLELKDRIFNFMNHDFHLNDLYNLIEDLEGSGIPKEQLSSMKESLFDELSHQRNYNFYSLHEKGDSISSDTYKLDFNASKLNEQNSYFFDKNIFEQAHQDIWFRKAISKLEQGKQYEALGSFSISQKVGPAVNSHPGLDLIMDNIFNSDYKLYEHNPELSFISDFKKENFDKTIESLENSEKGIRKELILMVDEKELDEVQNSPYLKDKIVSIEDESGVISKFEEKEGLNVRLIKKQSGTSQSSSFNIGAFKSLLSKPKYVSFLQMGDLVNEDFYTKLKGSDDSDKVLAVGNFGSVNSSGKRIDDISSRWNKYLSAHHLKDIKKLSMKHDFLHTSNYILSHKVLEEILRDELFVFDPRLTEFGYQQELLMKLFEKYSQDQISYIDEEVVRKVNNFNSTTKNGKKNVIFITSTLENTHGVPVVMNNIASNLSKDKYNVFYLVNDFDTHQIKLYDSSKNSFIGASNRDELLEIIKTHNPEFLDDIDIIHTHTWHVYDDFKHFYMNGKEEPMKFKKFLKNFKKSKLVYTEHGSPYCDLTEINSSFGVDFERLSKKEKKEFIKRNKIKKYDDTWRDRWAVTGLKCKQKVSELADCVINVSNDQHIKGKKLLPSYDLKDRITIYNGIDLFKYSDDPTVDNKTEEFRQRFHIDKGENVILYAGRFDEKKGIYDLASALKKLKKKGMDYKVLLAGTTPSPEEKKKFQKLVGDKDSIIYTGRIKDRKDLAALYRLADVTVQPTHGECFNQVIGESLSQGTPVVASDVSGPKEVYVNRGWAHGVESQNPKELSKKIYEVLTNKEKERQHVLGHILPSIRSELSLEKMVESHEKLYDKLIEKK